ncbi:hypothetical protein VNO78_19027 [Psophocarpus tetragonolobus]|uniref:Uncharacterized protein n=1 Tax=Psophocarpus tetragonolobus TaxID=3891 RepID=A0AAN9S890_PSOTE
MRWRKLCPVDYCGGAHYKRWEQTGFLRGSLMVTLGNVWQRVVGSRGECGKKKARHRELNSAYSTSPRMRQLVLSSSPEPRPTPKNYEVHIEHNNRNVQIDRCMCNAHEGAWKLKRRVPLGTKVKENNGV